MGDNEICDETGMKPDGSEIVHDATEPQPAPPLFEVLWDDAVDRRHARLRQVYEKNVPWARRRDLAPMKIDADDSFALLQVSSPYILKTPKSKVLHLSFSSLRLHVHT
jgi:hypothetical protein